MNSQPKKIESIPVGKLIEVKSFEKFKRLFIRRGGKESKALKYYLRGQTVWPASFGTYQRSA